MNTHAPSSKAYKGLGMEGPVAKWYAALTKRNLEDFRTLARQTADWLPSGSHVLEVAPGPGYFAIELAKLGDYQITGLDISETFVEIARRNAAEAVVRVDFRQGNAADLPFDSATFDHLLCRAAFKNFTEPVRALQEMYRVLRPGGTALIIDLRGDASKESVAEAVDGMHLGTVNRTITKLTFRFMLLKRAYTKRDFERFLAQTDCRDFEIRESSTGLEIEIEKA